MLNQYTYLHNKVLTYNDNFCCGKAKNSKGGGIIDNEDPEKYQYYYHSDHLGSSSYITNLSGNIVQLVEYVPFGEVFFRGKNNKWNSSFFFLVVYKIKINM